MLPRASLGLCLVGLGAIAACGRDASAVDSVADLTTDAGVWLADARLVSAALPARLGSFTPTEGADPFFTSYSSGPVFGSSCAYADGGRQLVVRIESGNIRARAAAAVALDAGAGDDRPHVVTVHGVPATVRFSRHGRTGEAAFVVARRYLVQLRLVPTDQEAEVVSLAEAIDTHALEALALDGVAR
jgi:hypothetical protein